MRAAGLAEPDPGAGDPGKREALRAGYLPIPWHPLFRTREPVPAALSRDWLEAQGLAPEGLAFLRPAATRIDTGLLGAPLALVEERAARRGGPDLWCYLDGKAVAMGPVQFAADRMVLFGAGTGETARLAAPGEPGSVTLPGRVVWTGFTAPPASGSRR